MKRLNPFVSSFERTLCAPDFYLQIEANLTQCPLFDVLYIAAHVQTCIDIASRKRNVKTFLASIDKLPTSDVFYTENVVMFQLVRWLKNEQGFRSLTPEYIAHMATTLQCAPWIPDKISSETYGRLIELIELLEDEDIKRTFRRDVGEYAVESLAHMTCWFDYLKRHNLNPEDVWNPMFHYCFSSLNAEVLEQYRDHLLPLDLTDIRECMNNDGILDVLEKYSTISVSDLLEDVVKFGSPKTCLWFLQRVNRDDTPSTILQKLEEKSTEIEPDSNEDSISRSLRRLGYTTEVFTNSSSLSNLFDYMLTNEEGGHVSKFFAHVDFSLITLKEHWYIFPSKEVLFVKASGRLSRKQIQTLLNWSISDALKKWFTLVLDE